MRFEAPRFVLDAGLRLIGKEVHLLRPTEEAARWLDARLFRLRPWATRPSFTWLNVELHVANLASDHQEHDHVATLLGKGPSLDEWMVDHDPSSGLVMGINEAALVAAGCRYAIACDAGPLARLARLDPRTVLLTPMTSCDTPPVDHLLFHPGEGVRGATAAHAVRILAGWGVRSLTMVGFDGMEEDAPGSAAQARSLDRVGNDPRSRADYHRENRAILEALRVADLEAVWWHRRKRAATRREGLPEGLR